MKVPMFALLFSTGLFASAVGHAANQPTRVDSKEYKVLLNASRFDDNPQSAAASVLSALNSRLSQLAFDNTIGGSFAAGDIDQLVYYDTAGSCVLNGNGYSLRGRQGGHSDIQFKFRHADEELSAFTDVSGAGKSASSKLETDISPGNLVYSHSSKQKPASGGAPSTVTDLISQFPGASTLARYANEKLAAVNGLNIRQQEYDGPSADLGKSKADFTLTLWYLGRSESPAVAELSFRVDADDNAYFTTQVLTRAQTLWLAINTLGGDWNITDSRGGKTSWLYKYRSTAYPDGFCD